MKQFEMLKHETIALVSHMGNGVGEMRTGYNSSSGLGNGSNDWEGRFVGHNSYGSGNARNSHN